MKGVQSLKPPPERVACAGTVRPGVSARRSGGFSVLVLAGPVDRELSSQANVLLQDMMLNHPGPVAIDVSDVDAVTGALLGLLLRATRRLAWRNRLLLIVCEPPELRRRLEIAGLDELATINVVFPSDASGLALPRSLSSK